MQLDTAATTTDAAAVPGRRFGALLWVAGMPGVVVMTVTVLPELLGTVALPAPLWVILLASFAQSGLLLALAVWAGVALARAVGLDAPVFKAAVTGRPIFPVLRPQLRPGLVAGALGGMLLFAVGRYAPAALAEAQQLFALPLVARVLYGGITEELLLRWGLMTTLVWLAWRSLRRRREAVQARFVWLAIAVSALLFGVGHLPAVAVLAGSLEAHVVVFVIGANTVIGLFFGYLYWRYGLEAAVIAHAVAHVVSDLIKLL